VPLNETLCYGLHDIHAPGMLTSVGAGWKQIFTSTHTQKHIDCDFIWRILLVSMSREHFPPKAASTMVLLFS